MSDKSDDFIRQAGLLSWIDLTLSKGDYSSVDEYMGRADPMYMNDVDILQILTITFWEKPRFPSRILFLRTAEKALEFRLGKQRAEALLSNRR